MMTGVEDSVLGAADKLWFMLLMVLAIIGMASLLAWAVGWRLSRPRVRKYEQYDLIKKSGASPPEQD